MGIKERREREKSMRRAQIEEAAKTMFMRKGFYSTTMGDIAEQAELSPATIYQYFQDKDHLYASLNLGALKYMTDKLGELQADPGIPVEEKLLKVKDILYQAYKKDPLALRVIFHVQLEDTISNLSNELLDELNRLGQLLMRQIAQIYEEGMGLGKFRKGQAIAYADIVWGIFAGLVVWEEAKRKVSPKKDYLSPTLDLAFRIFARGVSPEPDSKLEESEVVEE